MTSVYDVLVLGGRIFCDLIFSGLPSLPRLGEEIYCRKLIMTAGGPANTAVALRRLGLRPGLMADIGSDFFSGFVLDALLREDICPCLVQRHDFSAAAVTAAFPLAEDRAMATYVEAEEMPAYNASLLDEFAAPHLHVCGIGNGLHHLAFVRAAHARGLTVSLDCTCERVDLDAPETRALLAATDYVMPNAAEARAMTGADDVRQAGEILAGYGVAVIIKLGGDGAIALSEGRWIHEPAIDVEPVDTTGAGDCFAAGFIFGLLNHLGPAGCLRYGNIAGGLSTRGCGATSAPTLLELVQLAATTGSIAP